MFGFRVLVRYSLIFCQFQPGIAYRSVAYKKKLLTKNLILLILLLKSNQTYCIKFFLVTIFVSFYKLLNISLDRYSLFLSHLK